MADELRSAVGKVGDRRWYSTPTARRFGVTSLLSIFIITALANWPLAISGNRLDSLAVSEVASKDDASMGKARDHPLAEEPRQSLPNATIPPVENVTREDVASVRARTQRQAPDWQQHLPEGHIDLTYRLVALDTSRRSVSTVTVDDRFWLGIQADAKVLQNDQWVQTFVFASQVAILNSPDHVELLREVKPHRSYSLSDKTMLAGDQSVFGPFSLILSDLTVTQLNPGNEYFRGDLQIPIIVEALARRSGTAELSLRVPRPDPGKTNVVRHAMREPYPSEIRVEPLHLTILNKMDD